MGHQYDKQLAKIALNSEWITEDQLQECIKYKATLGNEKKSIIDILVEKQYLSKSQKQSLIDKLPSKPKSSRKSKGSKESKEAEEFKCEHCGTKFSLNITNMKGNVKCGQCGNILKKPTQKKKMSKGTMGRTLAFLMQKRSKASIPGYKIIKKIDEDSTGTIYQAQSKEDKKDYTIKLFNRETFKDKAFMTEVERSVKSILPLEIPNIRENYKIVHGEKSSFVVSKFIEGDTLATILERGIKITPEKAMKIIIRLCKILRYAKEESIIHGDINPENIIISNAGKVILANLGIPTKVVNNIIKKVEKTDIIPLYLAPELLSSDQRVDHRSDIYSIGALLYHLLAGKAPIEGTSPFEVLNRVTDNSALPPIQLYNPDIPYEISQIIEKMMSPDAEERYNDYTRLISHLQSPNKIYEEKEALEKGESIRAEQKEITATDTMDETISLDDGVEEKEEEIRTTQNKQRLPIPTIITCIIIFGAIGWWWHQSNEKAKFLKEADDEYFSIRKSYKRYKARPEKWNKLERAIDGFLRTYKGAKFPEFERGKTIYSELEYMKKSLAYIKKKKLTRDMRKRELKILQLLRAQQYCLAMEEYKKTPSYLMTSDNKRIINKLSYQITQGIEESIKAANKYYKAAIKDKNFAKGVKYVNNLLENIEKGAKTKKYFRKELETLKALKKILEKAEKKNKKRKLQAQKNRDKELYSKFNEKVNPYYQKREYAKALKELKYFKRTKGISKKLKKKIEAFELQLEELAQGKNIILETLRTLIKRKKINVFLKYERRTKRILKINRYGDLIFGRKKKRIYSSLSAEEIEKLLEIILPHAQKKHKYSLSCFCIELGKYTTAYKLLESISGENEKAQEKLEALKTNIVEFIEQRLPVYDTKQNDQRNPTSNAMRIKNDYLVTKDLHKKYSPDIDKYFLELFKNRYGRNRKMYIFDFDKKNDISRFRFKNSKYKQENGLLKFQRGYVELKPKNVRAVYCIIKMPKKNQRVNLILKATKPLYSFQIQGNGRATYGVYQAGKFENERLKDKVENKWILLSINIINQKIYWSINNKVRFRFALKNMQSVDTIQMQTSGGRKAPILFENLYIATKK